MPDVCVSSATLSPVRGLDDGAGVNDGDVAEDTGLSSKRETFDVRTEST